MNLAESLLHAFKIYGAREIFGIPGDFALPFFKVIEESKILPLYTLSHEPGVGFAADAAARFHCKPSVAAVTYGAGALNMINPVAAAYAEKSPVIVVSGGPGAGEKETGLLLHHQAKTLDSQLQMFKEVTCDQVILDDPQAAPSLIARVLNNCINQSRPVYIEIPRDLVNAPCQAVPAHQDTLTVDANALAACTGEIVSLLAAADSPALLVGVEIRRFGLEQQVAQLARKLSIPVATTFMGRGLLVDTDAPLVGTYMGAAGDPEITNLIENADALLMLGVIISDTNFGISAKKIDMNKAIVAHDGEVSLSYHSYADIPLRALVEALNTKVTGIDSSQTGCLQSYPADMPGDDADIKPTDIATAINDLFAEHGTMPIAADIGDCLFTALDIDNTALVAPGYYATMGFGVPAGMGLQAATGRRPLVLVGDGAFQMTGWELLNCPRYGFNPIVLVFNNKSWEMLRAFQPESQFNNLDALNFAKIAESLGGIGQQVKSRIQLKQSLDNAIADPKHFHIIDIQLDRGVLSSTLSRFVSSIKKSKEKT